jgi:WD40 repeat protein
LWFIALSPDGRTIARTGKDGDCYSMRLWDFETRKIITKWTGHVSNICALCWSVDGEQVASAFWDGTARIWDVDSRKTVLSIKTGHEWMRAVMYSPDSSKLATGGDGEDFARIWDAKTGELLNTPKHDSVVSSLGWMSDGQKLISGSFGSIRIFDTATWEQIAILEGHTCMGDCIGQNSHF